MKNNNTPYAITMWDFSYLERRFSGGGFEDWDKALDELCERGYNAVRIDAYPHLVWENPTKEWELVPCWTEHDWGCSEKCTVRIQPNLNIFLRKCKEHNVKVGLSTWTRENVGDNSLKITSAEVLVEMWDKTLKTIEKDLLDNILYIDMINEPPIKNYARFLPEDKDLSRSGQFFNNWMKTAIEGLRKLYPQFPITISSAMLDDWYKEDDSFMDVVDLHIWMSSGLFYSIVDYKYENYDPIGYQKMIERGEKLYNINPKFWQDNLKQKIEASVMYSKENTLPMMSTECWGVTNYKDLEGLNWGYVKELCKIGAIEASKSGRYVCVATSNFCSPQFKGMWEDVKWHKELTDIIKSSSVDRELQGFFKGDKK